MEIEQTIATQRIYEGKVVNLRVDTVQFPDGRTATREVVEHGDSIVVIPVEGQDTVLLVRQYRLPVGAVLLELPAGGMHGDESAEEAAIRELREEIGHTAGRLERLGGFYAAPGFCEEYLHCFIATELTEAPLEADDDESIEVVRVPLAEAVVLIDRGEIQDAKSIAGLLWAMRRLGKP